MQSITLQTGDTIVTSGDKLGQLQFAASAESDGSAALLVVGRVSYQAEGSFSSASNPSALILSTSTADANAVVDRIKITDNGHVLPMTDDSYDLGNSNLGFRNSYFSEGIVLDSNTPASTTNKLYQTAGSLYFDGSLVATAAGDVAVVEETAGGIATAEVQSVTVTGQGSYTIGNGVTQTEVSHSASVGTLQAAIDAAFPEITDEVVLVGQASNTYPTGVQAGDVAVYQGATNGLVPSDSGWTTRYSVSYLRFCTKTLNGTETGTIPTISSNGNLSTVRVFRGLTESDIEIIDTDGGGSVSPFDAVILNPLKTYKLFRGVEGEYRGEVTNTTGWTPRGNQNSAWVKTDTVSGVSSYSDTMSTFDDDAGSYVKRYTAAIPLTATLPITVSGVPGEYTLTWALFGDQDLITIADKDLTLDSVPYVGATADVNLGDYGVSASYATLSDIDTPASTTNKLYQTSGSLYFNGSLVGGGGGGAGTMTTVKANGSQVGGADIVTLDFSSDFTVTESPDTEINISLAGGGSTYTAGSGITIDGSDNIHVFAGSGYLWDLEVRDQIACSGALKTFLNTESDGATVTFNMDESNLHTVTLGGNRTLAVSNVDVGQRFILRLTQDGTGSRTVTWFGTIKWPGALVPSLTETANKTDVFGFICTSAGNYDGFVIGYNL